jgi:hypothetical protein
MAAVESDPKVAADSRRLVPTLLHLWPFMWPSNRPDLKTRVLLAFAALLLAKIITVLVPFFFKWATDALTGEEGAPDWFPVFLAVPLMLVLAYNLGRVVYTSLNQVRDALFARVGLHAVRQLAYRTFVHMHELSLRFHLERRTGGLSRVIERGTVGIETIVRHAILNSAPTLVEFALTAGIVWYQFDFWYVIVIAATVFLYLWFTIKASDWRIKIRREMNDSDTDAPLEGRRLAAELRDGQIFRQRGAGSRALRPLHGALREGGGPDLDVAGLAELWPDADLLDRHGDLHGDVGARRHGRHADDRRLHPDQCAAHAALHPAELHRLHLPRNRSGPHRHRGNV